MTEATVSMADRAAAGGAARSDDAREDVWSIRRCMTWCEGYLGRHGEERPRLVAEWLLGAATHLKRIELYLDLDRPMDERERTFVREGLRRRVAGEPLQYIIGETSFRQLDVFCEPGVLIPRPETELLVEFVLDYLDVEVLHRSCDEGRRRVELPWNAEIAEALAQERAEADGSRKEQPVSDGEAGPDGAVREDPSPIDRQADGSGADADGSRARVLEVGCGTGCISLSLAHERPGRVLCVATDIEPRAVALTGRNRARAGIAPEEVEVREGDLTTPVRPDEYGTFDVLVSNPPYVPSGVIGTLPREVAAFEPHLALDGGADGLDVFRRLLEAAPSLLRPGALFACELFETAVEPAADLCREAGFVDVRTATDMTDRPRFVLARRP